MVPGSAFDFDFELGHAMTTGYSACTTYCLELTGQLFLTVLRVLALPRGVHGNVWPTGPLDTPCSISPGAER